MEIIINYDLDWQDDFFLVDQLNVFVLRNEYDWSLGRKKREGFSQ